MSESGKKTIFISYRRADSPDTVKLIYERLKTELPRWEIFYDHKSIPLGETFPQRLRDEVTAADVVLVIIGPGWLEVLQQRKSQSGIDHVREEVRLAIESGHNVIPVQVVNARNLSGADLADFPELQALTTFNAHRIRPEPDFDNDFNGLVSFLEQIGPAEGAGTILGGKYKLVRELGAGGMGIVWLAEQLQPRRSVAVKLIKPGMDSREVLARFDAERQAVAVMDHPHIAKVFDAGKAISGRPYFAMEYVKGVPITEYCDSKRLSPKKRLLLFQQVCDAVQHAHQKGILHRDIKPGNVLVEEKDGKPIPKVIDFGLAKALGRKLTDQTLHTAFETRVGTLEYSSPEQAAGGSIDLDTRTDIYSLGALMYELLVGEPPFSREELLRAGYDEMRRIIKDQDPRRPSVKLSSSNSLPSVAVNRHLDPQKLTQVLRNDLDWIVMKALDKDRSRRYPSASGLAEEIERYLSGDPIIARPPSMGYVIRKYVNKHKGLVASIATITILLVVGIVSTSWFAFQANVAKNEARLAEQDAVREKGNAEKERDRAKQNEISERRSRASLQVMQAESSWRNNDVGRARQLLHVTPSENRDWEWRYLKRLCDGNQLTIELEGPATSVEWSPDGSQLLSASTTLESDLAGGVGVDNILKMPQRGERKLGLVSAWDARSGQLLVKSKDEFGPTIVASFVPYRVEQADAPSRVLSLAEALPATQGLLRIGDGTEEPSTFSARLRTANNSLPTHFKWVSAHFGAINSGRGLFASVVNLNQDGSVVGSKFNELNALLKSTQSKKKDPSQPVRVSFRVWDAVADQELSTWHFAGAPANGLLIDANGQQIVSSHADGSVRFWDIESKQESLTIASPESGSSKVCAISPDGRLVAIANGPIVRIFDRDAQSEQCTIRSHTGPSASAFDADGHRLAIGSWDQTVRVYDSQTGAELSVYRGHADTVTDVAFHPHDNMLASCSIDKTVKLWDLSVSDQRATLVKTPVLSDIRRLALPNSGPRIAVVRNSTVELWNVSTGIRERELGISRFAAISPDGGVVATGGIAPADDQLWLHFLDENGGRVIKCVGHAKSVEAAAFSTDGTRVVTVDYDGNWIAWQVKSGQKLSKIAEWAGRASSNYGIAFSPDGNQVLGSDSINQCLRVWSTDDGKVLHSFDLPKSRVSAYGMSEDGKRIVAVDGLGIGEPATLNVWELGHDRPRTTIPIGGGNVQAALVSPNSLRCFVSIYGKGVRVWDCETGTEKLTLTGPSEYVGPGDNVLALAQSPDGNRIARADFAGTILVWNGTPLPDKKR